MNALDRIAFQGGWALLSCVALAVGSGCAARVYSEPVGAYPAPAEEEAIVYVDTVPPNIEIYPHYAYAGGDAYYVDGRWYRRGPRGWGYYRQEPPELARQRPSAPYVVREEAPAPAIRRERVERSPEVERAPAPPRERPYVRQEPAVVRPPPGVVEAQPRVREAAPREVPAREAPSRERPAGERPPAKRPTPPGDREHEGSR